jgi:hypothetical protein
MESLQMFLPLRVPSNVDAALNALGAFLGAWVAVAWAWAGWIDRWERLRERWFEPQASSGALALLVVWPLALLFPAPVTFGLGQVLERLEAALVPWVIDVDWLNGWPLREVELQPILPASEVLCVALGLLLPCLLAFGVLRKWQYKGVAAVCLMLIGVLANALSAALTYGPVHAWGWLSGEVVLGILLALVLVFLGSFAIQRTCWALALVGLVWQLSLLNNASADVYFSQTLQTWEQGRFIRFHGLIQWLGWLWPFALLAYLLRRLSAGGR